MTNETKVKIVRAAIEAITRYGVRRVSMGDVAAEAGVSRQTLYANFDNKDALVSAAMIAATDDLLADLITAWGTCDAVGEILDAYFEHAVYRPFEIMQRLPDLRDLLMGVGGMSEETVKELYDRKSAELAKRLEPFRAQMVTAGTDPNAVAELVTRSTTEFKLSARDMVELRRLMVTLKASVVALTR